MLAAAVGVTSGRALRRIHSQGHFPKIPLDTASYKKYYVNYEIGLVPPLVCILFKTRALNPAPSSPFAIASRLISLELLPGASEKSEGRFDAGCRALHLTTEASRATADALEARGLW